MDHVWNHNIFNYWIIQTSFFQTLEPHENKAQLQKWKNANALQIGDIWHVLYVV